MTVRLRTLLGVALLAVGLSATAANAAAVLCIAPAGASSCATAFSGPVVLDEEFDVDLMVENVVGLNNFLLDDLLDDSFISFDPDVLQVADVSEGSFLRISGTGCSIAGNCTTFLFDTVDNVAGLVDFLFGGFNGADFAAEADGTGPLARITFRAIAIGNSPISIKGDPRFFFANSSFDFLAAPTVLDGSVRVIVPEPGTFALLGIGVLFAFFRRSRP